MMRSAPANDRRAGNGRRMSNGRRVTNGRRTPGSAPKSPSPPTLGLYAVHGHAWAEVVSEAEAELLGRMLRKRNGRRQLFSGLPRYTAVVYRGRLHRVADSGGDGAPFGQIEAFWSYLQRQLRAKGGVRRERLGSYLASFAWRYNRRKLPAAEQVRELMTLIRQPRQVD